MVGVCGAIIALMLLSFIVAGALGVPLVNNPAGSGWLAG